MREQLEGKGNSGDHVFTKFEMRFKGIAHSKMKFHHLLHTLMSISALVTSADPRSLSQVLQTERIPPNGNLLSPNNRLYTARVVLSKCLEDLVVQFDLKRQC